MDRKTIGKIIKYVPFLGLLAVYGVSFYQDMIIITDKIERNICAWTHILLIGASLGIIGSLLVMERFNILLTGKTPDIINDIAEENSQDVAVIYNGLIASSVFMSIIVAIYFRYLLTKNRFLLNLTIVLTIFVSFMTVIYIVAAYLKTKYEQPNNIFSKLSNPVFLPTIICTIQLFVTRKNTVDFVYRNIYQSPNDIYQILALIIVICYFLAVVFCHYSNIYCLVGFAYIKKDYRSIQKEIDILHEKSKKRESALREATKYVDERAEKVGVIKKFGLSLYFLCIHIQTYLLERYDAVKYLLLFINLRITQCLSSLLSPTRIRINGIRFFWSTAVFELLTLDFLLFIYLEDNDPCLKFFELLSTVIIIPVLLSWIDELKTTKE